MMLAHGLSRQHRTEAASHLQDLVVAGPQVARQRRVQHVREQRCSSGARQRQPEARVAKQLAGDACKNGKGVVDELISELLDQRTI